MGPDRIEERDEIARRIRAARGYAGLSRRALAARIARRLSDSGFSAATLKTWEDSKTVDPVPPHKRNVVAAATGMPVGFFYADLDRLTEIADPDNIRTPRAPIAAERPESSRDAGPDRPLPSTAALDRAAEQARQEVAKGRRGA